jgi:branched-chain amino acid transport system ATP-binding protein
MSETVLQLIGATCRFGGITAVDNVSLSIEKGEIVGLVGPNGAGKTTLVNLVTGFTRKTAGSVIFEGTDITRLRSYEIARRGVSRTFQVVQPFAEMTVLENVMAGALFAGHRSTLADASNQSMHYLEFVGLDRFAATPASQLSLANRKRLELAKSLAMQPRLLFLDEVNAGLNSSEIDNALELIRKIAATGITIVIIEHVLRVILPLVKRLIVLHQGALLTDGAPSAVLNEPSVIKAYLGTKFARRHQAYFDTSMNQN